MTELTMNLPISTTLMIAVLTAVRILCFIGMVLFLLLAIRAQFDDQVAMSWSLATGLAAGFWIAAGACGLARKALEERIKQG
jgi:predicted Kef-type K+ transport protein